MRLFRVSLSHLAFLVHLVLSIEGFWVVPLTNAPLRTSTTSSLKKSRGGYDESDGASKGIVATLTNLVNRWFEGDIDTGANTTSASLLDKDAPCSAEEVLPRIRDDYVQRNYLWTGDIDLACFAPDCVFSDPTIRFEGRDTFVTNVQNIRRLSDRLLGPCRSELRQIELKQAPREKQASSNGDDVEYYIESQWRMVGLLQGLPWQPCIDVPGRTQFWLTKRDTTNEEEGINDSTTSSYWQVCRYEEAWDIPARQALWQLVKPSGVYPEPQHENESQRKDETPTVSSSSSPS